MMNCNNDKTDDDDDDHVDKWNRKYTYSGCCMPAGWMTNDILCILVRWRKYEWKYFITAKMSSMWMHFFFVEWIVSSIYCNFLNGIRIYVHTPIHICESAGLMGGYCTLIDMNEVKLSIKWNRFLLNSVFIWKLVFAMFFFYKTSH